VYNDTGQKGPSHRMREQQAHGSNKQKKSSGTYKPRDVAIWRDEYFIVTAGAANCLVIYDQKGKLLRSIGTPSSGEFKGPAFLDIHGFEIFVSDRENHRVQVYDANTGTCLRTIGTAGKGNLQGELISPNGVVIVGSRLFVADTGISVFDARDGAFIALFGNSNSRPHNGPHGLCYDNNSGCIYVADTFNDRIQIWNVQEDFSEKGTIQISNSAPVGITMTMTELFISEHGTGQVSIWDIKEGKRIGTLRKSGDYFDTPYGMRIRSQNELVLCDNGNERILVFE